MRCVPLADYWQALGTLKFLMARSALSLWGLQSPSLTEERRCNGG